MPLNALVVAGCRPLQACILLPEWLRRKYTGAARRETEHKAMKQLRAGLAKTVQWSNGPTVGPMVQWWVQWLVQWQWPVQWSNGRSNGPMVVPMVQQSVQWFNGRSNGPMVGPMVEWLV